MVGMEDRLHRSDPSGATPPRPGEPARSPGGLRLFRVPAMDCAAEEGEIRAALGRVHGVRRLSFRLAQRTLGIDAPDEVIPQALEAIRQAGFDALPEGGDGLAGRSTGRGGHSVHEHEHEHEHRHGHGHGHGRRAGAGARGEPAFPWQPVVALLLALAAELLSLLGPETGPVTAAGMALAAGAIGLAGLGTYRKGLASLLRGRLNITALMTVAVTGAFLIGDWPEAAMVMALYAIAELIEARAVDRARDAIGRLLELAPDSAETLQPGGGWASVPVEDVPIGATVRVRPGARVPLDGTITAGASSLDQAPVTGESIPVDKTLGDAVFAGSINRTGTFELRVDAAAGDSTLARIIHAVEQAQGSRAPTQQFVDRFARVYTPAVFGLALAVAVLAPWLAGWSAIDAIYRALVLLVIACPCALVIATPVTVVSGLAAAARRGVLIKGGAHLEAAGTIRAVALDKTGTVTEGRPALVATEVLAAPQEQARVLRRAATLAAHSDHPVSRAIAQGLGADAGAAVLDGFTALAGRGVAGTVDGQPLVLGNHRLVEERGLCSPALEARLAAHEAQGRTVTMLCSSDAVLAVFAVADVIRERARGAVAELHALGVRTAMLSGDNAATVAEIARQAGVGQAHGNLLPADKLAAIEALRRAHGPVAMVGDGINDAPALARADIGIAMGAAGTDIAMEAADVVIMNDDLRRVADTVRLSRRTRAVLRQNVTIALAIKAAFLALAVAGSATMWMAVFADMGASLLVVFNGLRLLRMNGMRRA
jgi:Cd2+/Zn2+-exporting ATPase